MFRFFLILFFSIINIKATFSQELDLKNVQLVHDFYKKYHINPSINTDTINNRFFDYYLTISSNGISNFTVNELEEIKTKYKSKFLTDVIENKTENFISLDNQINERRKKIRELIYKDSSLKFDIQTSEVFDYTKQNFNTIEEIVSHFKNFLTLHIIYKSIRNYTLQEEISENDYLDIQKKCLEVFKNYNEKKDESKEKTSLEDRLCKALSYSFDPHTDFFSLEESENFTESLATTYKDFGIICGENEIQQLIIQHIVPGSSAWNSGSIQENDIIISLKKNNDTPIDLSMLDADDLNEYLVKLTATDQLHITLQNKIGETKTTSLVKTETTNYDNIFHGYILSDSTTKMGYIALPSFYEVWENPASQTNSSSDLAREILKLQKENIGGLILDLRDNGGGSLNEALQIAGLFIDVGPLCIVRYTIGRPEVLKDVNRGVFYSGKLILLVNEGSASASELLSASLQDHGRALIVGNKTYGKGSIQTQFPLNKNFLENPQSTNKESNSYIKLTLGKYYRINGKSVQELGVIPDIEIPSLYGGLVNFESENRTCLKTDTILKKTYYTPSEIISKNILLQNSIERCKKNSGFINHTKYINEIVSEEKQKIPVGIKSFCKMIIEEKNKSTNYEMKTNNLITIKENPNDTKLLNLNEFTKRINTETINALKKDIALEETFLIMKDFINQK